MGALAEEFADIAGMNKLAVKGILSKLYTSGAGSSRALGKIRRVSRPKIFTGVGKYIRRAFKRARGAKLPSHLKPKTRSTRKLRHKRGLRKSPRIGR